VQVLTHKLSFRLPLPIVLLVNGAKLLMDADFNERIRVLKLLVCQIQTKIKRFFFVKKGCIENRMNSGLSNPNFRWLIVK
jgi:hypothetical protein